MVDPWTIIAWSPEQEQIIYREWGLFYTKKQNLDVADLYYNKSLALNPDDSKALHFRSQCKRNIAQTEGALADAKHALSLDKLRQPFNLEVCDGIYELNEFENSKVTLTNYSRKFTGMKVNAFYNRLDVVHENFDASIGDTLGYFILNNKEYLDLAHREMMRLRNIDPRPLWKIMQELKECDVLSIPEQEEELLPPIEVARRKRAYSIFNQIYLRRSWIDVLFLKALTTDKNLLLPQSKRSRPLLEVLTKVKYEIVLKLLRMLHARSPIYTESIRNCPSRSRKEKQTEGFLFRIQHQVHRSMLKMLSRMNYLRAQRKLETLRNYVEEVMGDYVVLKTNRVMPWKFQFTNEVYNILGLAQIDQYESIPANIMQKHPKERLMTLLRLKTDVEKEKTPLPFGKRDPFADEGWADRKVLIQKALTARLSKRLIFAKNPIERAYLHHEIARSNLAQNSFDKCVSVAEKSYSEALDCNNQVWMFLAIMMICKAHAMPRKIEKISVTLKKAMDIAADLHNHKIIEFLKLCVTLNKSDLRDKKALDQMRVKSRSSRFSINSTVDTI